MIDIALDPSTNDLQIVDLGATLVTDIDQIAQNLAIRLRFILGEWYLNIFTGIPYYQYFFIKNPNQIQVETFLKDEINGTIGVQEITSFSSNFDGFTRSFSVNFACQALDDTITIQMDLP